MCLDFSLVRSCSETDFILTTNIAGFSKRRLNPDLEPHLTRKIETSAHGITGKIHCNTSLAHIYLRGYCCCITDLLCEGYERPHVRFVLRCGKISDCCTDMGHGSNFVGADHKASPIDLLLKKAKFVWVL